MTVQATAPDSITLAWDPNPTEEEVWGYRVSVGTVPGVFTQTFDVGNQTTFLYPNTIAGQEYFFSVVGYNILGNGEPSELSGFGNAPPSLVNPGNQKNSIGQAVALQLNGSDIYGEPVSYSVSGLPPGLTFSPGTGLISGAGTSIGIYSVTVTVTDGVLSTLRAFVWFIDGGPPTAVIMSPTPLATYTTPVGTVALGGVANDDLGITLVTWTNDRGGSGIATGTTTWTIPTVWLLPGANVITVTAQDVVGYTTTAVITVTHVNEPPTLVNPGNRTNAEGDVVSLQLSGGDPSDDPITYTVAGLPPGLTLDMSSGMISGTLPYNAAGVYPTTLAVSDSLTTTFELLAWTVTNTPLTVTPIVIAANKPYDGTTGAVLASCTLSGVAGPGLVAAYSFDEGAGTAAMDLSGYGNHGALVNATWTAAGRRGGALVFNGIDARVSIPDAPSLRLTTAMTLEAWVRSTTATADGAWRDLIYKGNDNYYLTATSPSDTPATGGTFSPTGNGEVRGPAPLATNAWTHLAATYDGAALRLYVNGMEVSSVAVTGSLSTSAFPLEIGGDSIFFGQFFEGIIDEVRVYNVALTWPQIQADLMLGANTIGCAGAAAFDSASFGAAKTVTVNGLALTGPAAAEFTLAAATATTTAAIEPRQVTAIVTGADKAYDGTTSATLASCTLGGVVGADAVGCTGTAAFATPGAGVGKTVTVTNLVLTGAAAGNYTPATTATTTTASIQPRTVTPTVTIGDKRFDGTTSATIASCTVSPLMGADAVECTGTAAFASADAGAGKIVTVSALTLTGAAAPNYSLATPATTTTATIHLNRAPVVTNPGEQSSFRGGGVVVPVTATDPDGDLFTFSATGLPPGITIDSSTGELSGTATSVGVFTVVLSASDGSAVGQASFLWSIDSPPVPDPASPVSPSGSIATRTPAFSWTADGSARYYLVSVSDASSDSPTRVWYTPEEAACPIGGTCTVAAPKSLASGLVTWMVLTWNPFGYGPWSTTMTTVVDVADAAVPAPALGAPFGPISTRTPAYSWGAIDSAIWYQLTVMDALGVVREFWYPPSQVCLSASCSVTPNVLLAIGPAEWKVRAWRTSGGGPWTAPLTFHATDSAPGTATLVSPLAPVATVTPSFTWNAVVGTGYYLLRVTDRDNVIVDRWYLPAGAGCPLGVGTCVASPSIPLKAGAANWNVLTWNGSGYGPWSATRQFLVEIADPAALTPAAVSPTGAIGATNVTYRWTAVAGALSYRIAIRNNGGAPTYWWYSPVAAGCQAAAECNATPSVTLFNGTADWRVQAWTTLGYGPWSPTVPLTVSIAAPPAPTLVSPSGPSGSASPAFGWNASANATLYYIRVYDFTGLRIDKWLSPAEAGCASGGICTLNAGVTLAGGAGSWQVIAWNPVAYSPWSSTLAFIVP